MLEESSPWIDLSTKYSFAKYYLNHQQVSTKHFEPQGCYFGAKIMDQLTWVLQTDFGFQVRQEIKDLMEVV